MSDSFGIKELVTARVRPIASRFGNKRLNLVIPTLDFAHSFGGITTAIRLMERLSGEFEAVRTIVTHQKTSDIDVSAWREWETGDEAHSSRSIVGLKDWESPVSVTQDDVFLATSWPTAVYVRNLMRRQIEVFPGANRHFVYFLQDYESGFYPWSVESWYAESTYRDTEDTIGLFNSKRLADLFHNRGVKFWREYVFEPLMHPELRATLHRTRGVKKDKLIYAYARPGLPRNGFDLLVDALKLWAREYSTAKEWAVVSFGGSHEDIVLDDGVVLRSMGKGSMRRYGDYLTRCWVGVSFQFMAHPSYSRLEMVDFGAWVVTNKIKDNDLTDLSPSLLCVDEPRPELVAEKIAWCCAQYRPGLNAVLPNLPTAFEERDDEFPIAAELVTAWCGGRA